MIAPKLLVIDVNNVILAGSSDPSSRFYRILYPADVVVKPNVLTAFELLFALEIPFRLATKQRAIGEGTLKRPLFDEIMRETLKRIHPPQFLHMAFGAGDILVEPKERDKTNLFKQIIAEHPTIAPGDMVVIDDSEHEIEAAWMLGMSAIKIGGRPSPNPGELVEHRSTAPMYLSLYHAICHLYSITP